MTKNPQQDNVLSFEKSFERLEEILGLMNEGKLSLDDSLKHFEEADKLISFCSKKLTSAEQKVQMLIKARDGGVKLGEDQKPEMKDFGRTLNESEVPF